MVTSLFSRDNREKDIIEKLKHIDTVTDSSDKITIHDGKNQLDDTRFTLDDSGIMHPYSFYDMNI